jgi:hypothetical protein
VLFSIEAIFFLFSIIILEEFIRKIENNCFLIELKSEARNDAYDAFNSTTISLHSIYFLKLVVSRSFSLHRNPAKFSRKTKFSIIMQ